MREAMPIEGRNERRHTDRVRPLPSFVLYSYDVYPRWSPVAFLFEFQFDVFSLPLLAISCSFRVFVLATRYAFLVLEIDSILCECDENTFVSFV